MKTHEAINKKLSKYNIDFAAGKGPEYMTSEWPWKSLWLSVEKEFQKVEIESVKKKLASSKGFETRQKSMESKA